jgi:hypothetical protein
VESLQYFEAEKLADAVPPIKERRNKWDKHALDVHRDEVFDFLLAL